MDQRWKGAPIATTPVGRDRDDPAGLVLSAVSMTRSFSPSTAPISISPAARTLALPHRAQTRRQPAPAAGVSTFATCTKIRRAVAVQALRLRLRDIIRANLPRLPAVSRSVNRRPLACSFQPFSPRRACRLWKSATVGTSCEFLVLSGPTYRAIREPRAIGDRNRIHRRTKRLTPRLKQI